MDSGSPDPAAALRRVGLGVTASQLAVHTALATSAPHSSADVDCAVGATPCLTAAGDSGYEIAKAEVIYRGRCLECVAATSISSGELKRTRSVRHRLGDTALDPEHPRSRAMSHQKETTREEKDRRV